ncbi:MAG: PepSY-like domain-containing protein [Bacteroidetes bacterium]|nr:PepSY-like domain-containing protein [Bacteroidota bacterium]MBL7103121.1 PepSY-like domain-containing protein [Bacteroidales bacterium]
MKKTFILFCVIGIFSLISCSQETIISKKDLPSEIKSYVDTHFPDQAILQSVKDKEGLTLSYEITLDNLTELEFNRKSEIIKIEGKNKLPDSVIPQKLLNYVNNNYSDNFITEWELDDRNQQIQLDNGLELEFKMDGNFLRIDN